MNEVRKLPLNPKITFFVGENGSGKSTLLEAIAVASGMNAEGGGRNFNFNTQETHSPLHEYLILARRAFPSDSFFLRSETYYNVATHIEGLEEEGPGFMDANYGGSPHERSHGESILALLDNRFYGDGLYLIDEPEAALSPQRQLALMLVLRRLVERQASQIIVATHSPIILAYPGATIYEFSEEGIRAIDYEESGCYGITKDFLSDPNRFMAALFREGGLL